MADEEVLPVPIPAPVDLKRKHGDLEPEAPEIPVSDTIADSISPSEPLKNPEEDDVNVTNGGGQDVSETKRPRLDENLDVDKNGYQDENLASLEKKDEKLSVNIDEEADKPIEEVTIQSVDSLQTSLDVAEKLDDETPSLADDNLPEEKQPSPEEVEASKTSAHDEVLKEGYVSSMDEPTISRKIEVPNNKVGVLIGKSGDTIRSLQNNSSAKIQITRDNEADPNSSMRPVEIIGTLENIIKAEKLIKDVIAEADAGGSPALVARGFNNAQSNETGEQVEIKVPNEKVGLIIGKGGETIKSLQMRSGARIQLIQQHGPDGDQHKERTVRLTGSKRQIETAREMIDEVMAQPVRSSSQSGGYGSQQGHRNRGPSGPPQWGSSRGSRPPPPHQPPSGYDYQRGPYPIQNQNHNHNQYQPSQYGGYPQQQHVPSRNNYGAGWDNRPPPSMQGPPAYDYYGGGGGQTEPPPPSSNHGQGPPMGPPHSNYNYGQDYGQQGGYGQSHGPPPHAQGGYGQSHAPPPYGGGYGGQQQQQPGGYGSQLGGGYPQDQYGKAAPTPSYGGQPPQGQSYYGQGRGPPVSDNTQYTNQNAVPPPQQVYPSYGSSGYPPSYGSADSYNQQPHGGPVAAPNYGGQQQQPVSGGYGQQQQLPVSGGYGQMGGYGSSYPSSQPSNYPDQQQQQQPPPAAQSNNAGGTYSGYQSTGDQAAYAGAYGQPVAAAAAGGQQGGYDQSAQQQQQQQAGGYGNGAPSGAAPPVGY